jgi:hypothetical protein
MHLIFDSYVLYIHYSYTYSVSFLKKIDLIYTSSIGYSDEQEDGIKICC